MPLFKIGTQSPLDEFRKKDAGFASESTEHRKLIPEIWEHEKITAEVSNEICRDALNGKFMPEKIARLVRLKTEARATVEVLQMLAAIEQSRLQQRRLSLRGLVKDSIVEVVTVGVECSHERRGQIQPP